MVELTGYRKFWLIFLILATLFTFFLSISQQGTPYLYFMQSLLWFPWIYFFVSWGYEYLTGNGKTKGTAGTSITLLGDDDPDTYILQKYLGYRGALAFAIISGIVLSFLFASEMLVSRQVWLPVSQPLSPSFQVPYSGIFTYFSTMNTQVVAFSNSLLPTIWENPSLIYLVITGGFLILNWSLRKFLDGFSANLLALTVSLLIAALSFPFIFHIFVYQAAAYAYIRAFVFVISMGIPSILTGFDFPLLAGHFVNNFIYNLFFSVSFGVILPPGV